MGRLSGLISGSRWARPATVAVVLLAVSGLIGALVAQTGGGRPSANLSDRATTLPVSASLAPPLSDAPLATTTTTPILPVASEPWLPATPSPPPAAPILTSKSGSDPVFYRLHISAPVVFVTVDDGWVRDPRVIDFVRQSGWPISVFLIERAAMGAPAYFRQLQSAGATIEDHTFDHPYLTALGTDRQTSEICRPMHDYPGMFGKSPTLLRPPYGAWNPTTTRVARSCGLAAVVEWSATYFEGRLAIAGGTHLRSGDVILLHFNSALYADLVRLRQLLASQGLAVGRLESYISGSTSVGQPAAATPPTVTTAPGSTTSVSSPATTQPSSTTSTTEP